MTGYRNDMTVLLTAIALTCILATASALQCYECNVWKAGYGNLCSEPRIRDDCRTCLKFETTIFMGFYKNTPRTSTVISRTCAKSKAVPYISGCIYTEMADGHNRRCYCNDKDLCNGAPKRTVSALVAVLFAAASASWRYIAL